MIPGKAEKPVKQKKKKKKPYLKLLFQRLVETIAGNGMAQLSPNLFIFFLSIFFYFFFKNLISMKQFISVHLYDHKGFT